MKKMQLAWKDMDTIESNRMIIFFLLGEEGVEKICSKSLQVPSNSCVEVFSGTSWRVLQYAII